MVNGTGPYWWQVIIGWGHWLGAFKQQAITWANVDPDVCCHMVSLGHNELNLKVAPNGARASVGAMMYA